MRTRTWILLTLAALPAGLLVPLTLVDGVGPAPRATSPVGADPASELAPVEATLVRGGAASARPDRAAPRQALAPRQPSDDERTGLRHADLMGLERDDPEALERLGRSIRAFEETGRPAFERFARDGSAPAAEAFNREVERFRAELGERYGDERAELLARRLRAVVVTAPHED